MENMTTNMKFEHFGPKNFGQSGHDSNGGALDGLKEILRNVAVGHKVDTNLFCVQILDTDFLAGKACVKTIDLAVSKIWTQKRFVSTSCPTATSRGAAARPSLPRPFESCPFVQLFFGPKCPNFMFVVKKKRAFFRSGGSGSL